MLATSSEGKRRQQTPVPNANQSDFPQKQQQRQRQRRSRSRLTVFLVALALFAVLSALLPLLLHSRLDIHGGTTRRLRPTPMGVATSTTPRKERESLRENDTLQDSTRGPKEVPIVAYAITVTKCGIGAKKGRKSSWARAQSTDTAVVWQHSVRLASHPLNPSARYGAKFYAFVYVTPRFPDNTGPCMELLENLGFEIIRKDLLVRNPLPHVLREFPNMKGRPPRRWVMDDGCCGEAEYMKLRMFELVNHPVVVHLDLDTILLKPLDELFDVIVHPPDDPRGRAAREHLVSEKLVAPTYEGGVHNVSAFYTKDWFSTKPGKGKVGVQGGFFVARPSLKVYDELRRIIKKGHYVLGRKKYSGWGGLGYGQQIEGSMTFQGIMAYYYEVVSSTGVELHMCKFNQMAANPRVTKDVVPRATPLDPVAAGYKERNLCRDGRKYCEDVQCQTWPIDDVRSLHFNFCSKPWTCPEPKVNTKVEGTCRAMHREWFKVRRKVEGERNLLGTYLPDTFLGYCTNSTAEGYIPIDYSS